MKYRAFLLTLVCLVALAASLLLAACGETAAPATGSIPLPTTNGMPESTPAQQPLDITPPSGPVKIIPGAVAPDFSLTDLNGQPIKLSDHRGQAVIINYWSVYCEYCRDEMPALVKTYQANRDKLNIIGIDINDEPAEVQDFIHQLKITYPIVIDNTGDLVYKYRITGRPTSIFINKNGIITGVVPGMATAEVLAEQLGRVLK